MGSDPLETSRINSFSMGVAWREPSSSSVRLGALDPASLSSSEPPSNTPSSVGNWKLPHAGHCSRSSCHSELNSRAAEYLASHAVHVRIAT